jgi:hypothetical protein
MKRIKQFSHVVIYNEDDDCYNVGTEVSYHNGETVFMVDQGWKGNMEEAGKEIAKRALNPIIIVDPESFVPMFVDKNGFYNDLEVEQEKLTTG